MDITIPYHSHQDLKTHEAKMSPYCTKTQDEKIINQNSTKLVGKRLNPCTHICFNVFYYFCFIPFKIFRSETSKSYCVKSTKIFYQIICAIVHFFISVICILEIRSLFTGKIRENPKLFFVILEEVVTFIFFVTYIDMAWFKKVASLNIFISASELESHVKMDPNKAGLLVKLFWFCMTAISAFAFTSKFKFHNGFSSLIQQIGPQIDFISKDTNLAVSILVPIVFFGEMYKWILIDSISTLRIILVVSCWRMAKKFRASLKLEEESDDNLTCDSDDEHIFMQYSQLKQYFQRINQVFGTFYAVDFLSLVTFGSRMLVNFMDAEDWTDRIRATIYLTIYIQIFLIAADAHYQASHFQKWLLQRPMDSFRHIGEYLAVENCNAGIRGGRFFTVTYSLLGTAGSIIVTYTIINLQFNNGK